MGPALSDDLAALAADAYVPRDLARSNCQDLWMKIV